MMINLNQLLKGSLLNNNQQMNENMDTFYESMKDSDNSIIDLAKNIAEDLKNESGDNPNNLMNMFNNGNGYKWINKFYYK